MTYKNNNSIPKVMLKLNNVPIKYFCAKFLSSSCLNLAIDFAVKTNAIEDQRFKIANSTIITRSKMPIKLP